MNIWYWMFVSDHFVQVPVNKLTWYWTNILPQYWYGCKPSLVTLLWKTNSLICCHGFILTELLNGNTIRSKNDCNVIPFTHYIWSPSIPHYYKYEKWKKEKKRQTFDVNQFMQSHRMPKVTHPTTDTVTLVPPHTNHVLVNSVELTADGADKKVTRWGWSV